MAISLKDVTKRLLCDGASKTFSLAGLIYLARTDLRVSLIAASGAETPWTLGVEYTLSGDGKASAGSLTTTALEAWPAGAAIFAYRDTDDIQNNVFSEGDGFPAKNTETAFDRRTARSQEIDAWLSRTLRTPLSSPPLNPVAQDFFRAGYLITFDAESQFETVIAKARLAMAPDGDTGPTIPATAARANRLPFFDGAANLALLSGLAGNTGLVTLQPNGQPVVRSVAETLGYDGSNDFHGGWYGLPGGDDFFGGWYGRT